MDSRRLTQDCRGKVRASIRAAGKALDSALAALGRLRATQPAVMQRRPAGATVLGHSPSRCRADGSHVVRSRWKGVGTEVVLDSIHGGAHAIPGSSELGARWLTARFVGYTNRHIQGPDHIWNFLKRYRH